DDRQLDLLADGQVEDDALEVMRVLDGLAVDGRDRVAVLEAGLGAGGVLQDAGDEHAVLVRQAQAPGQVEVLDVLDLDAEVAELAPNSRKGRSPLASMRTMARSVLGSTLTSLEGNLRPSASTTSTWSAPSTTW